MPTVLARFILPLGLVFLGATACGVPIAADELTPTVTPETALIVRSAGALMPASLLAETPAASGTGLETATATSSPPVPAATVVSQPSNTPTPAGPTATPTPIPPTPTPLPSGTNPSFPGQVVQILNNYRTQSGRSALTADSALMAAAGSYAKLMAERSWFTCGCDPHDGPDGSSPPSRIAAAGYSGRFVGEALTGGQGDAQGAMNAWLSSPAHTGILFDTNATDVGVGYYYNPNVVYGHYWVLVTGRD